MGSLHGKVAIVTGAGRGIGREHSLELAARHGATVVVVDPGVAVDGGASDEAPAAMVVDEIARTGGMALATDTSVTDWDACRGLVERTVAELGRLDIVVNNAGILRDRMITSLTRDDWDAVISVHLNGTFAMTKHACDHWRAVAKSGGTNAGRIINTTSGAGLRGAVGQSPYAAAKAAIAGLTQCTALEMGRYGVTANAISPVALTRMVTSATKVADELVAHPGPLHPGMSSPLVAYLASDVAGWLTGQVLRVEGASVYRMSTWQVGDGYTASDGERLTTDELDRALRSLYQVMPVGFDTIAKIS